MIESPTTKLDPSRLPFTPVLYSSLCREDPENDKYARKMEITSLRELRIAVSTDYVPCKYAHDTRSPENFLFSNCIVMDVTNDHSENPAEWKTPQDLQRIASGLFMLIHHRQDSMREVDGRAARPRFHVLFVCDTIRDLEVYRAAKAVLQEYFQCFDTGDGDTARFIPGTEQPQVDVIDGSMSLDAFLASRSIPMPHDPPSSLSGDTAGREPAPDTVEDVGISREEGNRYAASQPYSRKITEEEHLALAASAMNALVHENGVLRARAVFLADVRSRSIPEEQAEGIWRKALEEWVPVWLTGECRLNSSRHGGFLFCPDKMTMDSEAEQFFIVFHRAISFNESMGWMYFNGCVWECSEPGVRIMLHFLTDQQLKDAKSFPNDPLAQKYYDFALSCQSSARIETVLQKTRPRVHWAAAYFDRNEYLLCTPDGTYDLRVGLSSRHPWNPKDLITRITQACPSRGQNMELWQKQLNQTFGGSQELIDYVQLVAGSVCIDSAEREHLIIACGKDKSGMGMFWHILQQVLGNYACSCPADSLTRRGIRRDATRNTFLQGKRLVIASDLFNSGKLNADTLRELCRKEEITAEYRHKAPFTFPAGYTVVLCTDTRLDLPALDEDIRQKISVIPFNCSFCRGEDIRTLEENLLDQAGGAILSWMIEGAVRFIQNGFDLTMPAAVRKTECIF